MPAELDLVDARHAQDRWAAVADELAVRTHLHREMAEAQRLVTREIAFDPGKCLGAAECMRVEGHADRIAEDLGKGVQIGRRQWPEQEPGSLQDRDRHGEPSPARSPHVVT